jgi:hypothetical protein
MKPIDYQMCTLCVRPLVILLSVCLSGCGSAGGGSGPTGSTGPGPTPGDVTPPDIKITSIRITHQLNEPGRIVASASATLHPDVTVIFDCDGQSGANHLPTDDGNRHFAASLPVTVADAVGNVTILTVDVATDP